MDELVRRAREGDRVALNEMFHGIRPQLKVIAERSLDRRLGSRLDASDIVQQTMTDAFEAIEQLAIVTDRGLLAWLRTVLRHDVDDLVRKHIVAKTRSVRGQISIDASSPDGGALRDSLISDCSTPSNAAVRDEENAALYRALEKIRPDQAAAIRMRHLEGMPLDEIARTMSRSTNAVSQLILRGMTALKPLLEEDHLGYCRVRTNRS